MNDMEELKKIIYSFYPKNVNYCSNKYEISYEYLQRKKIIWDKFNNIEFKLYIKKSLDAIFSRYKVVDWIDQEEPKCFEYRILLHRDQDLLDDDIILISELGGRRVDLYLFISSIGEYYYYFLKETIYNLETNKWSFSTFLCKDDKVNRSIKQLKKFLVSNKYKEISSNIINYTINDVETEFKSIGQATIFDCLFTDLISPY